jgi:hypothetical protein
MGKDKKHKKHKHKHDKCAPAAAPQRRRGRRLTQRTGNSLCALCAAQEEAQEG